MRCYKELDRIGIIQNENSMKNNILVKVDSEVEAGQIVRNRLGMQIFGMRSKRIVYRSNSREDSFNKKYLRLLTKL